MSVFVGGENKRREKRWGKKGAPGAGAGAGAGAWVVVRKVEGEIHMNEVDIQMNGWYMFR